MERARRPAARSSSLFAARVPFGADRHRMRIAAHWLAAAISPCAARRRARRRHAAFREIAFLWGVRFRLGMGGSARAPWNRLLPEASVRRTVYSSPWAAPPRQRKRARA